MMDDCCAPQWTDLTSSPQVPSDDYFDKIHEVHEPQFFKPIKSQASNTKMLDSDETLKAEEFENDLSIIKSTPIKVISPNSKNENIVIKETTYDDLLCEAMRSLQLSVKKKKTRKSVVNQSTSNALKTPTARVLRSATRNSAKKILDESDVFKTPKVEQGRNVSQVVKHESSIYKTPKGQEVQGTSQDYTDNECSIYKVSHTDHLAQKIIIDESVTSTISSTEPLKENTQKVVDDDTDGSKEFNSHADNDTYAKSQQELDMQKSVEILNMIDGAENDAEKVLGEQIYEKSGIAEVEQHKGGVEKYTAATSKIPSNLVTSFKSQSNVNNRQDRKSSGTNQTKVLAGQYCQYRRRSLMKIRRRSGKYISLAEAVTRYQTGTPKRFRSVSNKETKLSAAAKLRRASLKLTIPISPALTSKMRTRPVTVLSQEQREELEIEEIKKHQIKANPLNVNALKAPQQLKKPEKKPITIPEPFHLTETQKMRAKSITNLQESGLSKTMKQDTTFKAPQPLKKLNKTCDSFTTSIFSRSRILSSSSQDGLRHDLPAKKLVPTVVTSDDKGIIVKNEEVLYFGIPNVQHTQKKSTLAVPFSFETRNKEFQKKKEEKLKQLHDQESHKIKSEFRAKPAPNFSKSQSSHSKETKTKRTSTAPCPLSFEARNNHLLKKKEDLAKQATMEEKKARTFHARPAPGFKPVVVHGIHRENKLKEKSSDLPKKCDTIDTRANKDKKTKNLNKLDSKTDAHVAHQEATTNFVDGEDHQKDVAIDMEKESGNKLGVDQENRQPNIMKHKITSGTLKTEKSGNKCQSKKYSMPLLNTDKRMKQRQQFDEKIRQKEMEEERKRQKAEEERLAKEKLEKAMMRKQAESKARPMPVYKPMVLVKSTKPLTNPQSPAFSFKFKQRVLAARVENEA